MVSTPKVPNGLFDKIERESEASCIYKRLNMDYTYGLSRIYSKEEMDKAKKSPSFGREYDLQYLGLIGIVVTDVQTKGERKRKYPMCHGRLKVKAEGWHSCLSSTSSQYNEPVQVLERSV
jgi:hypothetical protein